MYILVVRANTGIFTKGTIHAKHGSDAAYNGSADPNLHKKRITKAFQRK